jgi:hypothetical protein
VNELKDRNILPLRHAPATRVARFCHQVVGEYPSPLHGADQLPQPVVLLHGYPPKRIALTRGFEPLSLSHVYSRR